MEKLQELLQTEIWSKLGPEQDASIVVDRTGFPYVGAGMSVCPRDLARFGQLVINQIYNLAPISV
jgi:CubicO group peptidase (beta-lactamase class C family)